MIAHTVLAIVSELYPLMKTGGLADVAGALPPALAREGIAVRTLLPGYPAVTAALTDGEVVLALTDLFGGPAKVIAGRGAGHDLLVLDAPHLFDRPGNPYLAPDGRDWADNATRFAALDSVAARIAIGDCPGFVPDVVHAHDWQAGLTLAYLAYDGRRPPPSVMTVHNLAFQGRFPRHLLAALGLPDRSFAIDGVECYGDIGFLKAGLQFADRITTVSPTYAREVQTPDGGFGLDGLLRARSGVLSGIANGIDTDVWNPATDLRIPKRYDHSSLENRRANKAELQRAFGLERDPNRVLFGMVGRMTWQKGLDVLSEAAFALFEGDAQLAILGTGEADLESRMTALAAASFGSIGCVVGYDEDLAHLMQAGADALLVPSRFEPCGLTQLCAMRYGCIPVVSKVGGLNDTVVDIDAAGDMGAGTGIQFYPVTHEALESAVRRTLVLWSDPARWRKVQENGMAKDVSWQGPARHYAALFNELCVSRT